MDVRHPLVQAYLMLNEKDVEVKEYPPEVVDRLHEIIKEVSKEGCKHIIVNIGLMSGRWESIDVIACDGEIKGSSSELEAQMFTEPVSKVFIEVYEFPADLLSKLEEVSKIEISIPKEMETVRRFPVPELPPVTKEMMVGKSHLPIGLGRLEGVDPEKEVAIQVYDFLAKEGLDEMAVSVIRYKDGRVVVVALPPNTPKVKVNEIATNLATLFRTSREDIKRVEVIAGENRVTEEV